MSRKIATERMISAVWTMEYEMQDGGIFIHRFDRTNPRGYKEEDKHPRLRVDETETRIVKGVWMEDYKPYSLRANRQTATYHPVLNPKYIFHYEGEL